MVVAARTSNVDLHRAGVERSRSYCPAGLTINLLRLCSDKYAELGVGKIFRFTGYSSLGYEARGVG